MELRVRAKLTQFIIEAIIALFIFIIGLNSSLTESIFAEGIYPYISSIQRFITSIIPFAVGDLLYVVLVLYVLRSLNLFYRKVNNKRLVKADRYVIPLQVLNFLLILYISFKLLWGLNYSRPAIAKKLGIADEMYTNEQLVKLGNYFLVKLTQLKPVVDSANKHTLTYTIAELENKASFTYKKLAKVNPLFTYSHDDVKPVLNSWIINKMGISGYYNPLSGEANVNMKPPAFTLPFTTCHEIAHQIGVAKEDEANLIGYIVAINSPDVNFQYSAYAAVFRNVLFEIRFKSPEDYKLIYDQIPAGVLADFKAEKNFWLNYDGNMSAYLDTAFDQLLKLNNQRKGIKSYQDIVLWLYNFHKEEL